MKCFVPLCDAKNRDLPNRAMFLAPRNKALFAEWVEILPKVRPLRPIDRVCRLHFHSDDVITTFDHTINGEIFQLKRDRPRLKPDAVPCMALPDERELANFKAGRKRWRNVQPKKVAKSKESKISLQSIQTKSISPDLETYHLTEDDINEFLVDSPLENQNSNVCTKEVPAEQFTAEEEASAEEFQECDVCVLEENSDKSQTVQIFDTLYDNAYKVTLPNTLWGVHRCPERSVLFFSYMDRRKMRPTKMLSIDESGTVKFFVATRLQRTLQLLKHVRTTDEISHLLSELDNIRICFGEDSSAECEVIVTGADCTEDGEEIALCQTCLAHINEEEPESSLELTT